LNYKDFTIKARLKDLKKTEDILISLNARYVGEDAQTDYYFQTEKGKLKYRKGTIEHLITHYERAEIDGMEKTTVYRYDLNPSEEQIALLKAGHKLIGVVSKQRKIYRLNHLKFHLDTLPDGACFLEIEAIDLTDSFTEKELQDQCLRIWNMLGLSARDVIQTGYFVP
jgi:predicted adenylyl cyclase CyaB